MDLAMKLLVEPKNGRVKNKVGFSPCFCEWSKTALLRNGSGQVPDGFGHRTK